MYGNSFTLNIAQQMEKLDPRLAIEHFGGPGAPPNHSYACFVLRNETGQTRAPIQLFGVLADSLRRMLTISGLTTTFELPQPFTYPRYTLGSDGRLVPHQASIQSPDDLHAALADPVKWQAFVDELAANDAFYAPEMMHANFADHSVLLRMVRRAWGQRLLRDRTASLHPETGFDGATPEIASCTAGHFIVVDFADRARACQVKRPIVILFEDRGTAGCFRICWERTLEQKSHRICSDRAKWHSGRRSAQFRTRRAFLHHARSLFQNCSCNASVDE